MAYRICMLQSLQLSFSAASSAASQQKWLVTSITSFTSFPFTVAGVPTNTPA